MAGRDGAPPTITIYDVARAAGVAPSTVSRAFSRPGRVSAETAERVRRVAQELGYRANPVARALSTSRTRMIALVVSDIANPFYSGIVRGAQDAAGKAGYTVLLVDTRESDVRERAAVERAMATVDGILLASSRMSDSAIRMMSKQKPVVVLNRAIVDVPCVVTDIPRGMRRAAEWRESHIDGAVHIPLHDLLTRIDEIPEGEVWVHCEAGYRASIAASILAAAGRRVVAVDDEYRTAPTAGLVVTAAA